MANFKKEYKEEYKCKATCSQTNDEIFTYVYLGKDQEGRWMVISEIEMIKICRWYLDMTQTEFYDDICDQQAGSLFESTYKRNEDKRQDYIFSVLDEAYEIFPDTIPIGFVARILRQRDGDGINDAASHLDKSRVWVMHAEKGIYNPQSLIHLYS